MQEQNYIMTENVYFYDSYALIELLNGNPNYAKYENSTIITTKLNLFEVYHYFLRFEKKDMGEIFLHNFWKCAFDFSSSVIRNAVELKIAKNNRNVSMTDCIGYSFAKILKIPFLTGDKEFEKMENVEFVK